MWGMRHILTRFRKAARYANEMTAQSVIEELVLYLVVEESRDIMNEMDFDLDDTNHNYTEEDDIKYEAEGEYEYSYADWDQWAFDLFDDMDIETFLYDDI